MSVEVHTMALAPLAALRGRQVSHGEAGVA